MCGLYDIPMAASFGGMRQHRHGAATPNTNTMPLAALGHEAGTSLASQQGQQLHMGHARSDQNHQISCAQLLGHSPTHEPTALGQLCATPVWFLPCSCQMAHRVWPCPCPRAATMGHMHAANLAQCPCGRCVCGCLMLVCLTAPL